jgi:hypothetical protein
MALESHAFGCLLSELVLELVLSILVNGQQRECNDVAMKLILR